MPYKDPEAARRNRQERYRKNKVRDRAKRREIERKYREKARILNPEKVKEAYKKRYWLNREEQRRKHKIWRESLTEEQKERMRERRRVHHEANLARDYSIHRQWVESNRDKYRMASRRGQSKRRALKLKAFVETVDPLVVFQRDKGRCGICRRLVKSDKWHVDHVIPLCKGGTHSYDNVQLAHESCNVKKNAKMPIGQPTLFQVVAT